MVPSLVVAFAWVLFGGSHLLLSELRHRSRFGAAIGARQFTLILAGTTIFMMALLMGAVAAYGDRGVAGPSLASIPALKWILNASSLAGAGLAIAGLINYPRSPMVALARRQGWAGGMAARPLNPPTATERISRHPFFVGLALMMLSHALMAGTLAGTVYFAGFAVMAVVGILLQDRKLARRWGDVYTDFETGTSVVPLFRKSAVTKGGGFISPGRGFLKTVVATAVFILLHPVWCYANGAPFAAAVLVFGVAATVAALISRKSQDLRQAQHREVET